MSDEGSTGGDVMLVPVAGGEPRNLTPGFAGSASWIAWRPRGDVLVTAYADGETMIGTVSPARGRRRDGLARPALLTYFSLTRDGRAFAAVHESFTEAPEVWAGALAGGRAVTRLNTAVQAPWGEVKSLHWESDGQRVQGWLIAPPHVDPAVRHPLVVNVPRRTVFGLVAALALALDGHPAHPGLLRPPAQPARELRPGRGLHPGQREGLRLRRPARHPEGSGRGRGRRTHRSRARGHVRLELRRVHVDVGGDGDGSLQGRGGGRGIVNWQSYYGQNRIDQWMLPFFGASVYDDPAVYAKSSPITFIKNVKTPTLVLHGDRDSEVPRPRATSSGTP
jgi:hypothetical protein